MVGKPSFLLLVIYKKLNVDIYMNFRVSAVFMALFTRTVMLDEEPG
jgi:hypothetical protein